MTTITDTSILNWLPFDDHGGDLWRMAQGNTENQNGTNLNNSTTTLAMMVASKHGGTSSMFASPAQLGLATGLLLSLLINSRIWTTKANREVFGCKLLFGDPKPYQWILHLTPSSSFTFASSKSFILPYLYLLPIIAIVLLLPILLAFTILLSPFIIYRLIIHLYLQQLSNTSIKKNLFPGADAVWTFNESYESFSVINALIILEGQSDINKLREILRARLSPFPKLKMRHGFTLGYATWYEDPHLDIGSLVQWIPGEWGNADSKVNEVNGQAKNGGRRESNDQCDYETEKIDDENLLHTKWDRNNLSKVVEHLCNRPLPEGHTVSWEARVGKAMPWDESNGNEVHSFRIAEINPCLNEDSVGPTVFPILFRIHHSVGDGASLLQLLMSTLIDDESDLSMYNSRIENEKSGLTSIMRPLTLNFAPSIDNSPGYNITPDVPHPTLCEEFKYTPSTDVQDLKNFGDLRSQHNNGHIHDINIKEPKESSFLYGSRLSGKKTILWDSTSVTVEDIKKIRLATGVKFTDILLSAVSAALSSYWEARDKGQLNDVCHINKKCSIKYGKVLSEGHKLWGRSNQECESEDDWDRLEDVAEENDEDGCHQKDCSSEKRSNTNLGKPPTSVKLVLPAILGSLFQKQSDLSLKSDKVLENLFSVAVMTLPVGKSGGCPLQRLSKVSDASGYMMPLRKDSIVDCEKKIKTFMFTKDERPNESADYVSVADSPTTVMDKEPNSPHNLRGEMPSADSDKDNPRRSSSTTEQFEPEPIKTDRPQVLTYYYTKQSEEQIKSLPKISSSVKKTLQVQYCKNSDSTQLILSKKEPYHCPTTIFFTQNKEKNVDCQSMRESPLKIDFNGKSTWNESTHNMEITGDNAKSEGSKDLEIPRKTCSLKKQAISCTPSMLRNSKNKSDQNSKATSSIQFPSSPTIQHLLTRWLALDVVATVLPSIFAAPMMSIAANGVAVVMSNLPGPPKRLESILGGHPLKDIVFWAPHRGCTGLGVTILSYDGRLHIGLMADKAVVPTQKGAQLLMDTILDELHSLQAAVSSSR